MTTSLRCSAPAKINLALFVGEVGSDGRHELVTVFQPLDLADTLELTVNAGASADEVICPGVEGPNLAGDALAAYREATGYDGPPVVLTITKRIPIAGGMAGGSADAAAALRLIAKLAGDDDVNRLIEIGAPLGADVASQVRGRRAIGTGVGDKLRPSSARPDWEAVVLPVAAELSAGQVYAAADELTPPRGPEELKQLGVAVTAAERTGGGVERSGLVLNDLERAARGLCPEIDEARELLRSHRAEHVFVSGSGPTVVGLFPPGEAAAVAAAIGEQREAILARPEAEATLDPPRWP